MRVVLDLELSFAGGRARSGHRTRAATGTESLGRCRIDEKILVELIRERGLRRHALFVLGGRLPGEPAGESAELIEVDGGIVVIAARTDRHRERVGDVIGHLAEERLLQDLERRKVAEQVVGPDVRVRGAALRREHDVPRRYEVGIEIAEQPLQARIADRGDPQLLGRLILVVVLVRVRLTKVAIAGGESGDAKPERQQIGRPGFLRILLQGLVSCPVGCCRGDFESVRAVLDAQGLKPELVAVLLGRVERLIEGVGSGRAVDIGQSAGA